MKVEVVVISKEIIKPSSSTPDFLRKYKLSYLDQISPTLFMPLVYFYPADGKISNWERSNQLKKSLSEALTRFYPLAGRVVDNLYVDCNDEGVEFFQANAKVEMSEILSNPIPGELKQFLPYDLNDSREYCMAVQVSFLNCGGMAVGLIISHKIADAMSLHMFANSWAGIACGDTDIPYPKFEAATIFPPRDHVPVSKSVTKEEIVTKIFVFPTSKIDALKDRYSNTNGEKRRPTRIEALSTFIWSRFMSSTQVEANTNKIYSIEPIVNLRPRFDPPLSNDYFGNFWRPASLIITMDKDYEKESCGVVDKIREAISNVNGDYVAKLRQGYAAEMDIKDEKLVRFVFTSLCRFPIYEVDFGWGRPIWVASASHGMKNKVAFFDTQSGNGIEAWINLKKEDMAKFEADMELCSFLSPTM
ncbi:HXXXD-type acyl-transferase family protein [Abeliophyllum distichum]|uniref:HXXXD-type acyl-transferase family protein n=1 Tax=Abeliophyllum distichum TaxID=126358 RepID=A0ABD1W0X9_9LAMI